jgi:hypothetical protein
MERSANGAITTRVWCELGKLALEGVAVGLAFSILLAAAVYMVARNASGDAYYTTHAAPAEFAASAAAV